MHREKAAETWGGALPDWVGALAERADETSLSVVAREVGYSKSAVSNVIGNKYGAADTSAFEEAVRASIMRETVACPVFGETSLAQCLEWRQHAARPARTISSLHIQMRVACAACPKTGGTCDVE